MPDDAVSPAKKEAFQLAAQRFSSADFASNVLASPRDAEAMDVDVEYEQREPSSSSHDAKVARQNRARTTPDAKRAQNRESAKRFRVAQKKRWAELQETVERKDAEIERLKNMLQEVTTQHLASANQDQAPPAVSSEKVDSITLCELNMFVQLMVSRRDDTRGSSSHSGNRLTMPLVSGIGGLHRVVVSRLDGSVLGVRHKNNLLGEVMGGEVGGLVWDYVHVTDVAHLRFTVVHASRMASSLLKSEPNVFSYRRRKRVHESSGENEEQFLRMNGCVYPLAEENGEIKTVLFAEFIEM